MHFSICIPTLNEEKYIGGLLADLVTQTHRDFDVVVADGNSSDHTSEVVRTFVNKLKIKFLVSPQRGIPYLVFLDADSRISPDFLAAISARLTAHPFDFASSILIPNSPKILDRIIFSTFNYLFLIPMRHIQPAAFGAFICITKSAFTSINGFPENISFGEDVELSRLLHRRKFRFHLFRKPAVLFSTRRLDKEGRLQFILKILKAFFYYYFKGPITDNSSFQKKVLHEFGKF